MIKNICNVFIFVKDQNKAKEFWSKKMGFKIKEDIQIEGKYTWTEVIPQEGTTSLVLYPKSLRTDSKKSYKEITFFTDDIQSTYNELSSKGVKFLREPLDTGYGIFTEFNDDDGNIFSLKQT